MLTVTELDTGDEDLPLLRVSNDTVVLVFAPTVGGRLLSATLGGIEVLWRDKSIVDESFRVLRPRASWPTVNGRFDSWTDLGGSKTWPAPQGWAGEGEWAGPPDAVLDSGRWGIEVTTGDDLAVITMTSPDDPRTGLRVTRRFEIPSEGGNFSSTSTFLNVGDAPVRWAIWEVCQLDAASGGVAEIDVSDGETVDLGHYRGTLEVDTSRAGVARIPVQNVVAKVGFPSATGRLTFRDPAGRGISLRFSTEPERPYPDGGSRAELWMESPQAEAIAELSGLHPQQRLVELEALSPLTELAAGAECSLGLSWEIHPTSSTCVPRP
jgi:hypothetical protein